MIFRLINIAPKWFCKAIDVTLCLLEHQYMCSIVTLQLMYIDANGTEEVAHDVTCWICFTNITIWQYCICLSNFQVEVWKYCYRCSKLMFYSIIYIYIYIYIQTNCIACKDIWNVLVIVMANSYLHHANKRCVMRASWFLYCIAAAHITKSSIS